LRVWSRGKREGEILKDENRRKKYSINLPSSDFVENAWDKQKFNFLCIVIVIT